MMRELKRLFRFVLVLGVLLVILACSIPSNPTATESPIGEPSNDRAEELELNGSTVDQVATVSEGDTIGPIISVQLTNPTSGEVVVTIPCGLVFNPGPGSDEQSLMVIQETMVGIPGGETVTVEPYVVCIESSSSIPESGSAYQVGEMTTGNLLDFARCLCNEDLPESITSSPTAFQDIFGVQLAIWVVADNISFDDVLSGGGGAVSELEPILGPMLDLLESASQEWLDRCGIEIQP